MKNRRGLLRMTAVLVCLIMIGTMLPVISYAALNVPPLKSAKAEGTGIRVTWGAVSGASGYRVYRRTAGTGWSAIGDTTATSYKDNKAKEKVTYTYTVRAKDSNGKIASNYNGTGVSAAWNSSSAGLIATPKLVSATAEETGIRVKWNKVSGADGYRVYRKTTGNWSTLVTLGNVNNYLDTSAKSGTKYTYTVRCMISGSIRSDYDSKGVSATWTSAIAPGNIAAPKLIAAVAEGSGIRVTWNAVSGAAAYKVYRKNGDSGWKALVNVNDTKYLDNATNAGEVYTYTVRCLNASGTVISSYDKTGVSGSWKAPTPGNLATPILGDATSKVNGVLVTWGAVTGADGYRIYRKTESSGWSAIGETTGTSFTDTSAAGGTTYYYTVRAMSGGKVASGYDSAGKKIVFYATPKLTGAQSVASGVQITWNASKGAPMYLVYKKDGSSWKRLGTTTGTSYIDRAVVAGTAYTYTVRVVSTDAKEMLSDYDHTGVTTTFTGKASISTLTNVVGGVEIKWSEVAGATDYKVYRKTGEGGWTEIATVSGKTEYVDNTAVNNTTHTYRVRAMKGSEFIGSDDTNGVSQTYYAAPTLTNCVRSGGGLLTTWEAVEGIGNYVIYRRYDSGNWERVGTSTSTSYTDMTPPSGTYCYYTVRCADANGNPVSGFRTPGVGMTSYMDKPILKNPSIGSSSITIYWNAVDKAERYIVYRKTGEATSWTVPTGGECVSGTSFTDTSVVKGTTYTYTVAVRNTANTADLSEFDATGVKAGYYDAPTLTGIANSKTGVELKWNAVDYVGTYHIYRKTGNDADWVSIGTKSGTGTGITFTDTSVTSNAHYIYAVRSMISGVDASGLSNTKDITFYGAPVMASISNGNGSVTITWNQEAGIDKYAIYRNENGTNHTKIDTVSGTSYTDSTANTPGVKYAYAVRCVKDGKEVSALNSTKSITYVAPVTGVTATPKGSLKVQVTWTTEIGVTRYDVYRKTNNTGYSKIGEATGGSYTDTTPNSGSYWYRVVAIRDGSASAVNTEAFASSY